MIWNVFVLPGPCQNDQNLNEKHRRHQIGFGKIPPAQLCNHPTDLGCGHPRVAKEVHIFIQKNLRGEPAQSTVNKEHFTKGIGEGIWTICFHGWLVGGLVICLLNLR